MAGFIHTNLFIFVFYEHYRKNKVEYSSCTSPDKLNETHETSSHRNVNPISQLDRLHKNICFRLKLKGLKVISKYADCKLYCNNKYD